MHSQQLKNRASNRLLKLLQKNLSPMPSSQSPKLHLRREKKPRNLLPHPSSNSIAASSKTSQSTLFSLLSSWRCSWV